MNRLVLATAGGIAAGILLTSQVGPLIAEATKHDSSVYEQLDLFGDIFEKVRSDYVEPVDSQKLVEAAIQGMLSSLDPHSSYLSPKDYEDMMVKTKGEFSGLGIEVTQEEGVIKVISPIDGTPADKAGVEAGDFITHVNGESIVGLPLDQAVDLMRGPKGSEVIITIFREGRDQPFDISIIRDTVTLQSTSSRIIGNTAVLRITTFDSHATSGIKEALEKSIKELGGVENIDGVVLDLRNNPGGLLNEAISVSDLFLDAGEIVSTRGRHASDTKRYNAVTGDMIKDKPMVVLINGGSASASEIVTGALQDHRRAVVVGTKSFGKGTVQSPIPLKGDDGAMKLTTARYYTPSGRSIQTLGISPDIVVAQPAKQPAAEESKPEDALSIAARQRGEADLRGAISNDSMSEDEKKLYLEEQQAAEEAAKLRQEDYQLAYAVDILKGLSLAAEEISPAKAAQVSEKDQNE